MAGILGVSMYGLVEPKASEQRHVKLVDTRVRALQRAVGYAHISGAVGESSAMRFGLAGRNMAAE